MNRWMALAAGVSLAAFSTLAAAQAWPSKPIKYVVPFAAGGTTDILARTISEKLSVALGQPVVVENKPGAGGGVGAAEVAKAAPDGYTIMGGTISTHAINASLYKNLPYDPVKDFAAITLIARVPNMLVINNDIPAKNVAELIALMKANPGKWSFASSGNGTSQHLSGELFKGMAGVEMQHIPVQGQPARAHGRDGRAGQHDVRQHHDRVAAREERQAARARGHDREALAGRAGRADAGRVGPARLRDRLVAGRVRACRHAARRS